VLGACNLPSQPASQSPVDQPTLPVSIDDNDLATPIDEENIQIELLPTNTSVPTEGPAQPTNTAVAVQPTKVQVEDPTKTPLPEPTKAPEPTKVTVDVDTGDPAKFNGDPDWEEQFEKSNEVNFVQDSDSFSKAEVVDAEYIFSAKNMNQPAWRMANTHLEKLETNYAETLVTNITCHSNDDATGLFFRAPNLHTPDQGYLVGVTCGGQYYVDMWDGKAIPDGEMFTVIPPRNSDFVNKGNGAMNRIGVLSDAETGRSILYINGKPVDEFTSVVFTEGYVGLMVEAASSNGFGVAVDYVKIWDGSKIPGISHEVDPSTDVSQAEVRPYAFSNFIEQPWSSGDPSITLGTPTWKDYLYSAGNWGAFQTEYAIWTGNSAGELVVTGRQKEAAWVLATTEKIGDGAIEVVIDNDDCYMWDSYGMFFRAPSLTDGDRGYLFGTSCNAQYFVWRWDGKSGRMDRLVDYTRDIDHINYGKGQRNRFNIVTVGDTVNFYINGYYMTSITDDYWTEGYFGVFVRPQYDGGLTIRVDEASYWINEPAE
jgi:hypothetical protein